MSAVFRSVSGLWAGLCESTDIKCAAGSECCAGLLLSGYYCIALWYQFVFSMAFLSKRAQALVLAKARDNRPGGS